jgi:hypothetical protein
MLKEICPNCKLEIYIYEEVIECESCGLVMRVSKWDPLEFELLNKGSAQIATHNKVTKTQKKTQWDSVHRNVAIVKLKEPFLSWLKAIRHPDADMTAEGLNHTCTALLIPDFGFYEDSRAYIYSHFRAIFENELESWGDEADFPKELDVKMFEEWFDIEIYSTVLDMVDGEIAKGDEIDPDDE